jgi:hypothetical protein
MHIDRKIALIRKFPIEKCYRFILSGRITLRIRIRERNWEQ